MLKINIHLRRGDFQRHFQLDETARVIALTGASGAGKSSVLHAIVGLVQPLSGQIKIGERVLFDRATGINLPPHKRQVGYVFQDARLFPHLDVANNLRYGRHRQKGPVRFMFDEVVQLLGITPLLTRPTRNLSGGEAQRVAIGRALLSQPALLLLDEPLSALDPARRAELIPYLQRLRQEAHLPMLYVSHQSDEVEQLADVVHVLR